MEHHEPIDLVALVAAMTPEQRDYAALRITYEMAWLPEPSRWLRFKWFWRDAFDSYLHSP